MKGRPVAPPSRPRRQASDADMSPQSHPRESTHAMHNPTRMPHGINYLPTMEAAAHEITVRFDSNAPDSGCYEESTRTIHVREGSVAYTRSTITFQLAHAVLGHPSPEEVIAFAAERLINPEDFAAVTTVSSDPSFWARVLRVRDCLLQHYIRFFRSPVTA